MARGGKISRGESPKRRGSKKEKSFGFSAFDFPVQSFLVNAYFAGKNRVFINAIYHEMRVRMMSDQCVRDALKRLIEIGYVKDLGRGFYRALKQSDGNKLPKRVWNKNVNGQDVLMCPPRCSRGYGIKSILDDLE